MKYATLNENGGIEIRQDSSTELPAGAIALTDAEYDGLMCDTMTIVDSVVVAK